MRSCPLHRFGKNGDKQLIHVNVRIQALNKRSMVAEPFVQIAHSLSSITNLPIYINALDASNRTLGVLSDMVVWHVNLQQ
mmetsp:Transcript_25116/g.35972  ORF Transcript_25116/g.35972 Transcript_25116/m.35972 type:complete len:80 (+) Transcript_25116:2089-2328(+)